MNVLAKNKQYIAKLGNTWKFGGPHILEALGQWLQWL